MIEVEKYNAVDKLDALKREPYWLENLNAILNKTIPSRTREEYYENNKEEIKEYKKEYNKKHREYDIEYYENNKEQIKECKKEYNKNNEKKNTIKNIMKIMKIN